MKLGDFVKEEREKRGLTQRELGKLAGLTGSFISRIESGKYRGSSPETLIGLATALKIKPDILYKVLYNIKNSEAKSAHAKTPDDLISELMVSMPVAIPVVASVHAGPQEALDYAYWARSKDAKNLKALLVKGYCMSPLIEEGDIIIIDPDLSPSEGKILVCYNDGEIFLRKYGEHHDCSHIYGVIIGVNRRL